MKRIVMFLVLAVSLTGTAALAGSGDVAWFDPVNCAVCKNLAPVMGHMTWENYPTASGLVMVTSVEPDYRDKFAVANKSMMATIEKVMAGEKMQLCGCCQSFGELSAAGVKMESFPTASGEVCVASTADAKLVEKLHAHALRTNDEMKKMMDAKASHEGHGGK